MRDIEIKGSPKRGGYIRDIHLREYTVARVLMHIVGCNDDGVTRDARVSLSKIYTASSPDTANAAMSIHIRQTASKASSVFYAL